MLYFTADTHFDHAIWPISSEERLDALNKTVGPKDELWHLGDFAWRNEGSWRMKIRCKKVHLIIGNHDNVKPLFTSIQHVKELKYQGEYFWLSHYAHAYWPRSHYGAFHLYGHTHDKREPTLNEIWPERRSMDVGIGTAFRILGEYRPFSVDEVIEILKPMSGHDPVEWYKTNFGRLEGVL